MVLIIETIVEVLKACVSPVALFILALMILIVYIFKAGKYSLQGTTQGRYLTGGVPPVRFSMRYSNYRLWRLWW